MNPSRSLLYVPVPISGESPASWLSRVSMTHGVPTNKLLRALGVRLCFDPDLDLCMDSLRTVAYGTNVDPIHLFKLTDSFRSVRRDHAQQNLVHCTDGLPAYQYCPSCLQSDQVPYLRALWRFELWTICPIHLVRMRDSCQSCGAPIRTKAARSSSIALDGLECSRCGQHVVTHTLSPPVSHFDRQEFETQRLFVNLIQHGVSPPNEPDSDVLLAEEIARYLSFKSISARRYRRAQARKDDASGCSVDTGTLQRRNG